MLLETPYPIESGLLVLTAADKDKNFVEVKLWGRPQDLQFKIEERLFHTPPGLPID
jgi:hypothetical protein